MGNILIAHDQVDDAAARLVAQVEPQVLGQGDNERRMLVGAVGGMV